MRATLATWRQSDPRIGRFEKSWKIGQIWRPIAPLYGKSAPFLLFPMKIWCEIFHFKPSDLKSYEPSLSHIAPKWPQNGIFRQLQRQISPNVSPKWSENFPFTLKFDIKSFISSLQNWRQPWGTLAKLRQSACPWVWFGHPFAKSKSLALQLGCKKKKRKNWPTLEANFFPK